ncbi:hypothetical protein MRX96_020395 [Rhipicephalus microplus]
MKSRHRDGVWNAARQHHAIAAPADLDCAIGLGLPHATLPRHVSQYPQRRLQVLVKDDPFVVRKSEDFLLHLQGFNSGSFDGLPNEIEDLYYSVPHEGLLLAFRDRAEE